VICCHEWQDVAFFQRKPALFDGAFGALLSPFVVIYRENSTKIGFFAKLGAVDAAFFEIFRK